MTTQIANFPARLLLGMTLEPKEIGGRIKRARLRQGWTQLQLALEADVSPSTVTRWERGGLPPMRELIRLAAVLNVPAEDLVEDHLPQEEAERLEALIVRLERLVGLLERAASPTG